MRRELVRLTFVLALCLGLLSSPALADYKNFGIYQDTNGEGGVGDGVLNPGDTYIDGFMSWLTYYSAASSYNYGDHGDANLASNTYWTGAPYAADQESDPALSWLFATAGDRALAEDKLHIYMAWSVHDNNDADQIEDGRDGFSLGMIANNYIREEATSTGSGGYDLDIAIRNDGTTVPQVTLSDDYVPTNGDLPGQPTSPGTKLNSSQEYYKIADPDLFDPYGHHFEGRWDYTVKTGDGGVIGGIHNGDYDIDIDLSNIVTSISNDGLVIRIDPQDFDEVDTIVFYDFGYYNGANDVFGTTAPAGYKGHSADYAPLRIEIPFDGDDTKTFFIASIPETVPEPVTLLTLLISGTAVVLTRRRAKR